MCSWCYAFRESLAILKQQLPPQVTFYNVLGGLAADSVEPMAESMQHMIQQSWQKIEYTIPSIHFNFDFWKNNIPTRSTYPACRAVLVAQQYQRATKMVAQIQYAYYQNAQNPSDIKVLIECAQKIGLNIIKFEQDLLSDMIEQKLQQQLDLCSDLNITSFPSLRLKIHGHIHLVEIQYRDPHIILKTIDSLLSAAT
jgi:putative protein-disulfide isomerase